MEQKKNTKPGTTAKARAPHGSRNGPKGKPPALADHPTLPAFEPVPRKFRHDGWTPERQKAFIGALADTGCVSRAARYVNMSPEGAYWLRRQAGSDSFRRAWEAALDLGVQRLKDELYERALEGQLKPVFMGGKLAGFQRVKSDRLLMFALRMNAKDEYGRRRAATYFDPAAPRLHAGTGKSSSSEAVGQQRLSSSNEVVGHQVISDGGERAAKILPSTLGEGLGVGPVLNATPTKITETITGPTLSRARRDDINAAIVESFDPGALTLPEIEAMQAMLKEAAARHRAEEEGPPDEMTGVAFLENRDGTFKPVGPLEDVYPVKKPGEEEEEWRPEEDGWETL